MTEEFEPYNPYDPEQNELLKIQPSWQNPSMTYERSLEILDTLNTIITKVRDYIRVRMAMTHVEYITSYNYFCLNPITLSEVVPSHSTAPRHDFSKVALIPKPHFDPNDTASPYKHPVAR